MHLDICDDRAWHTVADVGVLGGCAAIVICLTFLLSGCVCVQVPEGRRGYETWRYKGGYWEARETGNWAGIREIYGDGPKGFTAPKLLY